MREWLPIHTIRHPIGFMSPFTHDHFNPNEFSTIKLK